MATAVVGRLDGAPATLTRVDDGWSLGGDHVVMPIDAVRQMTEGHFFPESAVIEPQITSLLFETAVRRAHSAVANLRNAEVHLVELSESSDDTFVLPFVRASHDLDQVLQDSITASVLSVAAAESQLNEWAASRGGWGEDEDRVAVTNKMELLAGRVGKSINLGRVPYQRLSVAVSRRHGYVHPGASRNVSLRGSAAVVPGRTAAAEAREACLGVRQALVALARLIGEPLPDYLRLCPPDDPPTEDAWGAYVLAGIRDDPDFPPSSLSSGAQGGMTDRVVRPVELEP